MHIFDILVDYRFEQRSDVFGSKSRDSATDFGNEEFQFGMRFSKA
jgi:hypothetical protein